MPRYVIAVGDLTAELRGRQWVVLRVGQTVGWVAPTGTGWSLSLLEGSAAPDRFETPRDALKWVAERA